MSETFALVLSKLLTSTEVRTAFVDLLPGARVTIIDARDSFPDDPGDVLAQLNPTLDPNWPVAVDILIFPDPSPIGPLPALRLAEAISTRTGANVLTDVAGLIAELDPHDPYWWLAFIEGQWHLADAAETPLMGPYTDGTRTFPGDGTLKLVRPVNPWALHPT